MKVLPTTLPELRLLELAIHGDARGSFREAFRRDRYREVGIAMELVQDNWSTSVAGALRGLHYRVGTPEGKLVHVVRGEIFDVAVDVRRSSPTLGQWFGTTLSAENRRQMWIPPGFAHGFYAVTDADVVYKISGYYEPTGERAIRWDDRDLAIAWPGTNPILSPKDGVAPAFRDNELLP